MFILVNRNCLSARGEIFRRGEVVEVDDEAGKALLASEDYVAVMPPEGAAEEAAEEAAKEPYKGFLCEACSNDNGSASPACGDDAPTQQYLASFHKEGEKNNHSCHAKLSYRS